MRPQPKGEVHSAREDDCQTVPQRTEGSLGMVQTAPARSCERAAENPERQAPRPLPVLRTTYELPSYSAVLSESPLHLARMAETADKWKAADVGKVCRKPTSAPAATTSDHTSPRMSKALRLKNTMRAISSAGSVRMDTSIETSW